MGGRIAQVRNLKSEKIASAHEHTLKNLSLAWGAVGQLSCQTQRQIAAWEERFAEGNPREEYAAYVKEREENARSLRQAVAEAATMRIRVIFFHGKDKVIPPDGRGSQRCP